MSIQTDYDENTQIIMDEANELLNKKKTHWKELNDIVNNASDQIKLPPNVIKKLKDYHHYYHNGWGYDEQGNEDPLIRTKGTKFPDRVSTPFIKFLEVIQNCYLAGDYELLEPYLASLEKHGVSITINLPKCQKNNLYDDTMNSLCAQQTIICETADKLNEQYKDKFNSHSICGKRTFNTALNSYNRVKSGKDISRSLHNLYVDSASDTKFASVLIDENKNNIGND